MLLLLPMAGLGLKTRVVAEGQKGEQMGCRLVGEGKVVAEVDLLACSFWSREQHASGRLLLRFLASGQEGLHRPEKRKEWFPTQDPMMVHRVRWIGCALCLQSDCRAVHLSNGTTDQSLRRIELETR